MSLFFSRSTATLDGVLRATGVALRGQSNGTLATPETAMRHSGVWACRRLRADLISTTPIDVFRRAFGVQVEMPKPPLLIDTGGDQVHLEEWLYSSQMDLDGYGNTVGPIVMRDAVGNPQVIELASMQNVRCIGEGSRVVEWWINGQKYDPKDVWHEKQFTVPGIPVGLSPIQYSAYSVGTYLSAQEFALDWFGSGAAPSGHLKNSAATVDDKTAAATKEKFKNAVKNRDVLVTGKDWEFNFAEVPASTVMFLEEMKYGIGDVCRFYGVPGDLIDAETTSGSITYASISQRNLQLLIMNLGPAFVRREKALSRALPRPRFVKFNTDATVLRMDPESRSRKILAEVSGRTLAPSEARELDNRPPFTDEQLAEFDRLFGKPRENTPTTKIGVPA